jgi:hypothetical protein
MQNNDLWSRNHRRYPARGRSFWDDHARAMELRVQGNQILARAIVDRLGCLWRDLRRWFVTMMHDTDQHPRPP